MKRHYSPNHPSVRSRQDNYNTPYLTPSVAERREAVRQRIGSRNNTPGLAVFCGVCLFLSAGLVENKPFLSFIMLSLAVTTVPTLLGRIKR